MRVTEERRGSPDRSRTGRAREVDLLRATRNDIRAQHGIDFDRILVPGWTTANRPTTPLLGDFGLNETTGKHEGYDGTNWITLSGGADERVTFTATDSYSYTHSLGQRPDVTVLLDSGLEIEVEVIHDDSNTVSIYFNGTISDGVLLLS